MTDPIRISLSTNHTGITETRYEFGIGGGDCTPGTKDCYPIEYNAQPDYALVTGDQVQIFDGDQLMWSGKKSDVAAFNPQDAKDIESGIYALEHPTPPRVYTPAPAAAPSPNSQPAEPLSPERQREIEEFLREQAGRKGNWRG